MHDSVTGPRNIKPVINKCRKLRYKGSNTEHFP